MLKAFEICRLCRDEVENAFAAWSTPSASARRPMVAPHRASTASSCCSADEPNIREVIAFPMNQRAEDLMMNAPAEVPDERLRELHLRKVLPKA